MTTLGQQTRVGLDRSWLGLALLGAGLVVRLQLAWLTFLNPDEALHYFVSRQGSAALAYRASLATAHPPLMILFLNYWSRLGNSEFFLRLPFVVAGVLFCWIMFLWLREISNQDTAFYALALFLFLPSLISLSAEIRQYSPMLFFGAACLYSMERAFEKGSVRWMALSIASLYLALLTHYSALVFLAAVGIYGLLRLFERGVRPKLTAAWMAGQAGAVMICVFLFNSQVSQLRHAGLPAEIAQTWLRTSIFQRGQDQIPAFAWSRTVRLFRYIFSHGTIGALALLLFVLAVALLLSSKNRDRLQCGGRPLAALLGLPFLITLGSALAGIYPYGGTRHDVVLALFAIPAVGLALDWLKNRLQRHGKWAVPLLLAVGLMIINLFPYPSGPYIRPRNQDRKLMGEAMTLVNSLPADSVLFTDHQGSLVLGFYLCRWTEPPTGQQDESFARSRCGKDYMLSAREETFNRATFTPTLDNAWRSVGQTTLYLFESGWIDDNEKEWLTELHQLGGTPRNFGPNILICPIGKSTPLRGDKAEKDSTSAGY